MFRDVSLKDYDGCFTTKFNIGEQERSMCGAITLSNGGQEEELNDSLNGRAVDKNNQVCGDTVLIFM